MFNLEAKIENLVKESKIGTKSVQILNLPIMKHAERRVVHELAAYYGVETQSFDQEPHRNVCLYASRDKSFLPSQSLTQTIDLRTKQPTMSRLNIKLFNQSTIAPIKSNLKVLGNSSIPVSSAFSMLSDEANLVDTNSSQSINSKDSNATKSETKVIDYFDMTD
jgi:hypothetical protein